jgi:chromosome segregation ATPase
MVDLDALQDLANRVADEGIEGWSLIHDAADEIERLKDKLEREREHAEEMEYLVGQVENERNEIRDGIRETIENATSVVEAHQHLEALLDDQEDINGRDAR